MSITQRIYLLVALAAVMAGSLAWVGASSMMRIGNELSDIAERDVPLTEVVTAITVHELEQALLVEKVMRLGGVTGAEKAANLSTLAARVHQLDDQIAMEIDRALVLVTEASTTARTLETRSKMTAIEGEITAVKAQHDVYAKLSEAVVDAIRDGDMASATAQVQRLQTVQADMLDRLNGLEAEVLALTRTASETALRHEQEALRLLIAIGGVGTIVGVLFGIVLARGMSRAVEGMTDAMTQLADGDLGVEIDAKATGRRDEIGTMARALEVFRDTMKRAKTLEAEQHAAEARLVAERRNAMLTVADNFEQTVGGVVQSIGTSVTQMRQSTETLSSKVDETNIQTVSAAGATEQTARNVETVASATQELSSTITEISQRVTELSDSSRETAALFRQTDWEMEELRNQTDGITEIVILIEEIAAKVNMLAMNAAIEAQRAGSAGRGFAVVAGEVKELADATSSATGRIAEQVASMRSIGERAVASVGMARARVERVDDILTSISAAVEEQQMATDEIARSASEAADGASTMSRSVNVVRDGASESGDAANEVSMATDYLSRQGLALQKAVDGFLREVRAA